MDTTTTPMLLATWSITTTLSDGKTSHPNYATAQPFPYSVTAKSRWERSRMQVALGGAL